jgi:hypothetical protein
MRSIDNAPFGEDRRLVDRLAGAGAFFARAFAAAGFFALVVFRSAATVLSVDRRS